ncbi:hypothetical protein A2U01_0055318, partial [Trifolium medium]|nr:hypothetical protein [Trifolium medium]
MLVEVGPVATASKLIGLHPDLVCEYLEVEATLPLFFRVFKLQRQPVKNGQHGWVSLKQQIKFFKMFIDSVRGFKE